MSALDDRRLVARGLLALVLANVRYWLTVAPVVRAELGRWERRARAIPDPDLRGLALAKLHDESFHAEAGAMLATLAPPARRKDVVEAIVALELLFDYLDGLTERPSPDPLREGDRLFTAFTDAVNPTARAERDYFGRDAPSDGGYLEDLSGAARVALARLPATPAIAEVAQQCATRSAQAQIRMHAAPQVGTAQLEEWASNEARGTGLQWRELLAGAASSVLMLHALIAAAADERTTRESAVEIEATYLSICALLTLLDGLVDYEQDIKAGETSYVSFFEDHAALTQTLVEVSRRAATQARSLPGGADHLMMLAGVVAYFTSNPGAQSELARPIVERLHAELRPLITPTLALMRAWRLAKALRQRTAEPQRPPKRRRLW